MLSVMFKCDERGVLASGGVPWSDDEIAAAIGGDIAANVSCIGELLAKGVAKRDKRGAIFSGRMVRDEQERQQTKSRVQKYRSNGNCNAAVTPVKRPCTEDEDENEVVVDSREEKQIVKFDLEAFDGSEAFEKLCQVYKKSQRSALASQLFFEAVEWVVSRRKIRRSEAAAYILGRAEIYCSMKPVKWQQKLTDWLNDRTFEQEESAWGETGKGDLEKLYGDES